jgi:large subunit ribosomal protein L25
MATIGNLAAVARTRTGTGGARATRREGRIPGIVYGGADSPPLLIAMEPRAIDRELRRAGFYARLFDLTIEGQAVRVLPREVQFDPVSDRPIHIDFLRITAGARVTVSVPVRFLNESESPGLKAGGVINVVRHEIELVCPVEAIPEHIDIDLTGLAIGDSVHISAIKLPEGVRPTIIGRDFTIASVAPPTKMVVEVEAAAPVEGAEAAVAGAPAAAAEAAPEKEKGKE